MKEYIGITIGPIFDTFDLVTSPGALWCASYMFSTVSRLICKKLTECNIKKENIVSPCYNENYMEIQKSNGIGLYNDRIYFEKGDFDIKSFNDDVRKPVIDDLSKIFDVDSDYLNEYIMMNAVEFDAEDGGNVILTGGKILDSVELAHSFMSKEENNKLLSLLYSRNSGNDRNRNIKEVGKRLGLNEENWQLIRNNRIRSLEDISGCTKFRNLKHADYYAIVRADGDNMSTAISSLENKDDLVGFSNACFDYCKKVADTVGKYGGVTIYAGGDDLLAILPCVSPDGKSVFEFVKDANADFEEAFKGIAEKLAEAQKKAQKKGKTIKKVTLSLSFGILIAHHKFPLYEAMSESEDLLFVTAKNSKRKNCVALKLQKHSGQSEGLVIYNDAIGKGDSGDLSAIDSITKLYAKVTERQGEDDSDIEIKDRLILSVLHKLDLFKELVTVTDSDEDSVKTLFKNLFDAYENDFIHKILPGIYSKIAKEQLRIYAVDDKGVHDGDNEPVKKDAVLTLCYLLRVMKFFIEKKAARKETTSRK